MDHLSEAQLTRLRARLEGERRGLVERLATDADGMSGARAAEPGDFQDAPANDAGHFQAGSLRTRDRLRLAQVEAALARMDDGSYGICEDSDDEIPFRRLEVEPTTRFTVAAQEQREREGGVADPHGNEPIVY